MESAATQPVVELRSLRHVRWNLPCLVLVMLAQNSLVFALPHLNEFWSKRGLDLTDVALLQVVFYVTIGLVDIPAGYFADSVGRKPSLLIASISELLGMIVYTFAHSFVDLAIAEVFFGLGTAFFSGAFQAAAVETLEMMGKGSYYSRFLSGARGSMFLFAVIGCVVGGRLSLIDDRLPLALSSLFGLLAVFSCFLMVEPEREKLIRKGHPLKEMWMITVQTVRERGEIRRVVILWVTVSVWLNMSLWFYQPYFDLSGTPKSYFGWIFAAFNIAAWIGCRNAYRISGRDNLRKATLLVGGSLFFSYLLMGLFQFPWGFVLVIIHQIMRGVPEVVFDGVLQRELSSDVRGTVTSVRSFASMVLQGIAILLAAVFAGSYGIPAMFITSAFIGGSVLVFVVSRMKGF